MSRGALPAIVVVTALAGCAGEGAAIPDPEAAALDEAVAYVELGDFEAIRAHGRIRFANVARPRLDALPGLRGRMPRRDDLARAFADRVGLELVVVEFASEQEARTALLDGRVAAIVGRSGPGIAQPPDGVVHSTPFAATPGVLVGRAGEVPASVEELSGRRVTFAPSSPLIGFTDALVEANPAVTVDTADIATAEDAIDGVLAGTNDLTLTERWIAEAVVGLEPSLEIGAEFGEVRYTAAVRSTAPDLLRLVNDFAYQVRVAGGPGEERHADLAEIRDSRVLRVLTVNGPSSYYVHKGELVGFDYELVRMFAAEQDVIVQMVVAPSVERLEPWLRRGLGDMIGAGLLPTSLADRAAVRATRPYHDVWPVIVARPGLDVRGEPGYRGRTVLVARNNPYLPMLRGLSATVGFHLALATDTESPRAILGRIHRGESDLTVLESQLMTAQLAEFPDLQVVDSLTDAPGRSWAVRADQPELLAALNGFVGREVGGLTHAVLIRKYFRPDTRRVDPPEVGVGAPLSPWDDTMRSLAGAAELDWRLLTAQMFQESRFDPTATSPSGAYGLMQMMPSTFLQMRVRDREDPEQQIDAGVRYMRWLYDRFPSDLELADRLAFTLASYNAGYGHVSDARRVAALRGLDPDRWFESVELAMLSLSDPAVYRETRYGFVRGSEPVRYVRRVNELGQMYVRLAPSD